MKLMHTIPLGVLDLEPISRLTLPALAEISTHTESDGGKVEVTMRGVAQPYPVCMLSGDIDMTKASQWLASSFYGGTTKFDGFFDQLDRATRTSLGARNFVHRCVVEESFLDENFFPQSFFALEERSTT